MCLYFALMYKTLGGYNWSDLFGNNTSNSTNISPISEPIITTPLPDDDFNDEPIESLDKSIFESAKDLQSSFHGLKAVSSVPFIEHCVFLTHNNTEFKFLLFFVILGIHNRCVSRFVRFCNVVDLLCMVCCVLIGNALSVIFHKILNRNLNICIYTKEQNVHASYVDRHCILNRHILSATYRFCK